MAIPPLVKGWKSLCMGPLFIDIIYNYKERNLHPYPTTDMGIFICYQTVSKPGFPPITWLMMAIIFFIHFGMVVVFLPNSTILTLIVGYLMVFLLA
jgi:hypothetical protein